MMMHLMRVLVYVSNFSLPGVCRFLIQKAEKNLKKALKDGNN